MVDRIDELCTHMLGRVVRNIARQEFWYEGELAEQCNALYFRCSGSRSVRLGLDSGAFFWYLAEPELPPAADRCGYRLVDLTEALRGETLSAIIVRDLKGGGTELLLRFASGSFVQVIDRDDKSEMSFRTA